MKTLAVAKLTQLRTLSLPEAVLEQLGLQPGDQVEFLQAADGSVLLQRPRRKFGALGQKLTLAAATESPIPTDFLKGYDSTSPAPIAL